LNLKTRTSDLLYALLSTDVVPNSPCITVGSPNAATTNVVLTTDSVNTYNISDFYLESSICASLDPVTYTIAMSNGSSLSTYVTIDSNTQ
jgi:hypothetical protein